MNAAYIFLVESQVVQFWDLAIHIKLPASHRSFHHSATDWKLLQQPMHCAKPHRKLPVSLTHAKNEFENPSHSLTKPFCKIFYHTGACDTGPEGRMYHCGTQIRLPPKALPWWNSQQSPLRAWSWTEHCHAHCITILPNHPTDVHVICCLVNN